MLVEKHSLASGTAYVTPYYVIKSGVPGPVFMIVSGIHGNETASMRAALRMVSLFRHNRLRLKRGTLIVVPIANRRAHARGIRGVPDLNRTFPRSRKREAIHPLSAAICRLMYTYRPSWYLDLHEANGLSQLSSRVLGQSLVVSPGSPAESAVRHVLQGINRTIAASSRRFNIRLRSRPGSSRMAASRLLGAKAVTVETCWSLDHPVRVRYQMDIVRRFLRYAGLTT